MPIQSSCHCLGIPQHHWKILLSLLLIDLSSSLQRHLWTTAVFTFFFQRLRRPGNEWTSLVSNLSCMFQDSFLTNWVYYDININSLRPLPTGWSSEFIIFIQRITCWCILWILIRQAIDCIRPISFSVLITLQSSLEGMVPTFCTVCWLCNPRC
jgi:hypothetical protein